MCIHRSDTNYTTKFLNIHKYAQKLEMYIKINFFKNLCMYADRIQVQSYMNLQCVYVHMYVYTVEIQY